MFLTQRQSRRLAELRATWGQRVVRRHRLSAISDACRSRVKLCAETPAVDARTWIDLDFDDVFAAIDRTESTLGQQALYHRLQQQHSGDGLRVFEALVARMSQDAAARERAQLALARLQDAHGYDLWWLGQPDAADRRAWHVVFPFLTVVTITLAALAVYAHAFVPWLVGLVLFDVALRYRAADQMTRLAGALRQVAPVVLTGQQLGFLKGDDIDPLVGTLAADAARLRRLKTIARWLSGDPFLSSGSSGLTAVVAGLAKHDRPERVAVRLSA